MKIDFDEEVDAAYLQLDDSQIVESQEVLPGVVFDFNSQGGVVGIEILGVRKRDIHHLLSLKIPFSHSADLQAFESFVRSTASV